MKIAIYPGTFDPITNGHIDVIERSSLLFDKVIVAVLGTVDNKQLIFNREERLELVNKSVSNFKNVQVEIFDELLVKYVKSKKATVIIRGLRAISDFEYEFQMTGMNKNLFPGLETVFLMSSEKYSFISSKLVKEVHNLGGNIDKFVSPFVIKYLNKNNK